MKLYVGNLPWSVDDKALKELFASYGVEEATLIKDKYSGRSKGFGFVTITDDKSAEKAISEMNKKGIEGRELTVSEAKPMVSRDNAPRYNDSNESMGAPVENFSTVEQGDEDEPEVIDDNSDAEDDEEDIETVEEAKEDAEEDD
ncbi:MAG: RNA-binding protein [archaeon]